MNNICSSMEDPKYKEIQKVGEEIANKVRKHRIDADKNQLPSKANIKDDKKVSEVNTDIDTDKSDTNTKEKSYDIPDFAPITDEDCLALEIAEKWGERRNLKQLLRNIYRVSADRARPKFADVDELPIEKIKVSRGALFIWLLQRMKNKKRFDNKG